MKKAGILVLVLSMFLVLVFSFSFASAVCGDGVYEPASEDCDYGTELQGYWGANGCIYPVISTMTNKCRCFGYPDFNSCVQSDYQGGCYIMGSPDVTGAEIYSFGIDSITSTGSSATVICNAAVSRTSNTCDNQRSPTDNQVSYTGTLKIKVNGVVVATRSLSGILPYTGRADTYDLFANINSGTGDAKCELDVTGMVPVDSGNLGIPGLPVEVTLCDSSQPTWWSSQLNAFVDSCYKSVSDFDIDGETKDGGDCDDWPFDDGVSDGSFKCVDSNNPPRQSPALAYDVIRGEILLKMQNCSISQQRGDSNNNGIGDYAKCSYCRNPSMAEDADDVDNNCMGYCQGNASRSCYVDEGYSGDGEDQVLNQYGYEGCGGVTNDFGQLDSFCQMVDDHVSYLSDENFLKNCSGYNRAVKWGERAYAYNDLGQLGTYTIPPGILAILGVKAESYALLTYKPGGVQISNEIPSEIPLKSGYFTLQGRIINKDSDASKKLIKLCYADSTNPEDSNTVSACAKFSRKPIDITGDWYLPTTESKGKTRGTYSAFETFPDQFIDSFRGELNFTEFWNAPRVRAKIQEKDANGNFIWQWQTACVPKDKCADDASNSVPKDLFVTEPYGYFITKPDVYYNDQLINFNQKFNVRLVDVDNPECKFNTPSPVVAGAVPPTYSAPEHKINPINNQPYCLDDDGDGFCGCVMVKQWKRCQTRDTAGACIGWSLDWINGIPALADDVYARQQFCNDTLSRNYGMSKQFPDCDDKLTDDNSEYVDFQNNRIRVGPAYGFSPETNRPLSAFDVHPLAATTNSQKVCSLGFDLNCNKDYEEGADISSLLYGGTPFDTNKETGSERSVASDTSLLSLPLGTRPSNMDMTCALQNPSAVFWQIAGHGTMVVGAVVVGGALLITGVGAVAGAGAALGVANSLMVVGVGANSYQIGGSLTGLQNQWTQMLSGEPITAELSNVDWPQFALGAVNLGTCIIGGYAAGNPRIDINPLSSGNKISVAYTRKSVGWTEEQWRNYLKKRSGEIETPTKKTGLGNVLKEELPIEEIKIINSEEHRFILKERRSSTYDEATLSVFKNQIVNNPESVNAIDANQWLTSIGPGYGEAADRNPGLLYLLDRIDKLKLRGWSIKLIPREIPGTDAIGLTIPSRKLIIVSETIGRSSTSNIRYDITWNLAHETWHALDDLPSSLVLSSDGVLVQTAGQAMIDAATLNSQSLAQLRTMNLLRNADSIDVILKAPLIRGFTNVLTLNEFNAELFAFKVMKSIRSGANFETVKLTSYEIDSVLSICKSRGKCATDTAWAGTKNLYREVFGQGKDNFVEPSGETRDYIIMGGLLALGLEIYKINSYLDAEKKQKQDCEYLATGTAISQEDKEYYNIAPGVHPYWDEKVKLCRKFGIYLPDSPPLI